MTSGLAQVCKLLFAISRGMLPVKHLAPKILMAVYYWGRQLAQRLGWAAPAYRRREGATPHLGACKHSLLYDGSFVVRVWNFGSLSEKGEEACEELKERMIDVCCLQEVSWRELG